MMPPLGGQLTAVNQRVILPVLAGTRVFVEVAGATYTGLTLLCEKKAPWASAWTPVFLGSTIAGGLDVSPPDGATRLYVADDLTVGGSLRISCLAITGGAANVILTDAGLQLTPDQLTGLARNDLLTEMRDLLTEIRDETRASRLAAQESYNLGNYVDPVDFLELARAAADVRPDVNEET